MMPARLKGSKLVVRQVQQQPEPQAARVLYRPYPMTKDLPAQALREEILLLQAAQQLKIYSKPM